MWVCAGRGWLGGIDLASPSHWLGFGVYVAAGFVVLARGRDDASAVRRGEFASPRFWLVIAGALFILGVNKLFDVGQLLTSVGRCAALAAGQYGERREFMGVYAGMVAALGIVGFWAAARGLGANFRGLAAPLAALAALGGYAVFRAASFHGVDAILRKGASGLSLGAMIELVLLAIIAASARSRGRGNAVDRAIDYGGGAMQNPRDPSGKAPGPSGKTDD
ncbi:MAG: hypothetical protein R3C40_01165 [Parvularculaceae bacterium]